MPKVSHLRKLSKRLQKSLGKDVPLMKVQHAVAQTYGYESWDQAISRNDEAEFSIHVTSSGTTTIFVNDEQAGLLESLEFKAQKDILFPQVKASIIYDPDENIESSSFNETARKTENLLKDFPFVQVKMVKMGWDKLRRQLDSPRTFDSLKDMFDDIIAYLEHHEGHFIMYDEPAGSHRWQVFDGLNNGAAAVWKVPFEAMPKLLDLFPGIQRHLLRESFKTIEGRVAVTRSLQQQADQNRTRPREDPSSV